MNNLRKLRNEKRVTQTEVAKNIGISYQALGLYENEKNKPDPDTLWKLADYFGVTIDYLLGREPDSGLVYVHKDPALTEDEKHVLELYRNIVPESRELTLSILEQMPKVSQDKKQSKKDV